MKEKYLLALMDMACRFGETSEATRLKVGCIIYKNDAIISLGVNGQPPGWPTECCEKDGKTLETVRHAEDSALQKLWNSAETAKGAVMFVSHKPCIHCSIKIATAGISKVYYRYDYRSDEGSDYLMRRSIPIVKIN